MLNLEFIEKNSNNILVDNCHVACRFTTGYKHLLHSENPHLNGFTDLILNLGENLEKESSKYKHHIEQTYNVVDNTTKLLKELIDNLEYIKEQNNQIINEFKKIKKELSDKKEITQNIKSAIKEDDLEKIIRGISKLNIGEKPKITPYKHWAPRK